LVRIFKRAKLHVAQCLDLPVVTQAATLGQLAAKPEGSNCPSFGGEDLTALALDPYPPVIASFELDEVVDAQA
jgi:hypothetical protein